MAGKKVKSTKSQWKRGKRIYIQDLKPIHFNVGPLCVSADDDQSSIRKRMSKLPRESPARCLWRARMGKDNKNLYFSVLLRVKNAHYKGTGDYTGKGYHWQKRWKIVYDRRTDKAFDAKKHMSNFLRGKLS